MNVLIVDDDATNRKLLRVVLEAENHHVFDANDGVDALDVLDRETIDAVISDILMPNMDGYRLCQEIRRSERFNGIPFITYTSTYTSAGDEKLAIDCGADKYLRKPAPAQLLRDTLQEVSTNGKTAVPRHSVISDPQTVMQQYSEALVRKLEEKNLDLERATEEIRKNNEELEERVRARTAELKAANEELDAFSHSVAHDLRAPLRAIGGYSQMLMEDDESQLSRDAIDALERIKASTKKMNSLIDELLRLSHVNRCNITEVSIDLSDLVRSILEDLQNADPERQVELVVEPNVVAKGDKPLLQIALTNLLSNAWKFSGKTKEARIEFGQKMADGQTVYFVRDNGVGFDMAYEDKLFAAFERIHSPLEFPGTGLGLTIVQRIIARHGGRIWVESAPDRGATFRWVLE